jgi:hypothetical protein
MAAWSKQKKKKIKDSKGECGKCTHIKKMQQQQDTAHGKVLDKDWEANISENPSNSSLSRHLQSEPPQSELPPTPEPEEQKPSLLKHIFQAYATFGLFTVSWDAWKSSIWDLFTHTGFFTYVHHDGSGYATFAFVREGCKIWGIHRPKITDAHNSRSKVFDVMRSILNPHGILNYMTHTDLYNVFLMKGDVLYVYLVLSSGSILTSHLQNTTSQCHSSSLYARQLHRVRRTFLQLVHTPSNRVGAPVRQVLLSFIHQCGS